MDEYFVDWRWAALRDRRNIRMVNYWKGMKDAGIDEVKAEKFLSEIWMICAANMDFDYLRRARRDEEEEARAYEVLKHYHPHLPRPVADEAIIRATESRKKNGALDCGRYLVAEANKRFGRPVYVAIAQAVTVGLDLENDLEPTVLKQACYDLKRRNR